MTASAPEPPKRENKFKAFFRSRSRSRSRPQNPTPSDPMPSDPNPDPDPYTQLTRPHAPHPLKDSSSLDNPPSSYTKSSVRPQTRPVSSTTIATHSTITPLPSDALRNRMNRGRHAYAYYPQSTDTHMSLQDHDQSSGSCEHDSDDLHFPRSETPSSTTPKSVVHSFFGISFTRGSSSTVSTPHQSSFTSDRQGSTSTSASEPRSKSSRKRSFRFSSRPPTPKSVDESPSKSPYSIPIPSSPLPLSASPRRRSFGLAASQRNTPKSSTGHLPLPHVQAVQPVRSHGRRHSAASERPPHDSAVALPEEPSHRSVHKSNHILHDGGGRNKGKEREKLLVDSEVPLPDSLPSVDFTSQSLPADSSAIYRNFLPSQSTGHSALQHLSTVDSVPFEGNEQPSLLTPHHLPVIPRIIHTPPTPQRPGETDSSSAPSASLPGADSDGKAEIPKSKTVTITHREQVLVSNSSSHSDVQQPGPFKGRFTPRFFGGKDSPKTKDISGQKLNRRPVAGSPDGPAHKTSATSPARNMTTHRSKLGSFDFERPVSALNKSCSTVGQQGVHVPKDNTSYTKPSLHSLERTISNDSARGGNSRVIVYHSGEAELPILSQLKPDHTGDVSVLSFSSISLQTKSTGKGTGGTTLAGQSSSWGRVSGNHVLRTSHGTFAFEHPSSVPSSPNPQTFNLPIGPNQNDIAGHGLPQSQPTSLLSNTFDAKAKHLRGQSYNTSDYVDPSYPKRRERTSKGKGRSLDLGLGLSWAPSRIREEVLMPGLILSQEKAKQERSKATGSDVTKVFESLLSESRFQTFKKYVHRFDAHIIPLEGPIGLLARVEKLLVESGLGEQERSRLMTEFTIFVENHSG